MASRTAMESGLTAIETVLWIGARSSKRRVLTVMVTVGLTAAKSRELTATPTESRISASPSSSCPSFLAIPRSGAGLTIAMSTGFQIGLRSAAIQTLTAMETGSLTCARLPKAAVRMTAMRMAHSISVSLREILSSTATRMGCLTDASNHASIP